MSKKAPTGAPTGVLARLASACLLAAALVLTGCGSSEGPKNSPPKALPEAMAPATDQASPSEDAESLTKPFGSTFTWKSGAAITVSAPTPFKPSEYTTVTGTWDEFVSMEVTLTNGTKEAQEPLVWTVHATSGDKEAEQVFDSQALGESMPAAKVLPGKTIKYKVGFARTKGAEFVVQVGWNFGQEGDDGYYQ